MAAKTQTYTVGVASAAITLPTDKDVYLSFKSHKANTGVIWVRESSDLTVAATVDGDDTYLIEPGEAVLMRKHGDQMNCIATVAGQKLTVSVAQGRVR